MLESSLGKSDLLKNDTNSNAVFSEAAEQLPSAAEDWAKDAWSHKAQFLEKTGLTAAESALAGGLISYVLPCRGPAALAVGALMMAPVVYKMGENLIQAHSAAELPGANLQKIGHQLAYNTVDGAYNLGVSFAGGYAGARIGGAIADSNTYAGKLSQDFRSQIFGNKSTIEGQLVPNDGPMSTKEELAQFEPNRRGGGGGRGGHGGEPPPVVDGPPGVLTSLEGVPRSEVTVAGSVSKLLPQDTQGLPHQRFLIQLSDGSNIFVANDTHYGTEVPGLQVGNPITIKGEWIPEPGNWGGTDTAGVLHWTHKGDAGSSHPGGWIEYGGNHYDLIGLHNLDTLK